MRVVDYVIDQVYRAGAKHVFTITGGGAMFLNDAVAAHPLIEPVCNHHEQASAMAAVAYSKYTGKPSLVCPTTGCGGTNTITGLLDAWQDSVPVVFVSGNVNLHQISPPGVRNLGVQEARIVEIVQSITKYAKLIESGDEVEETVTEALRLCTEGRPGPVWIDIPMDIQGKEMDVFDFEKEILKAKRPLILAGGGVATSMPRDDFRDFVAGMKIPVVTTFNAVDLITDDDPYFVGRVGVKGTRAGNFAMQNCDFLLVLGSRLAVPATGYNYKTFAREAKVVVVDIDKKEHSKDTVKIDHFIQSDVKDFVKKVGYPSVAFWHQQLEGSDEWQKKCVEW